MHKSIVFIALLVCVLSASARVVVDEDGEEDFDFGEDEGYLGSTTVLLDEEQSQAQAHGIKFDDEIDLRVAAMQQRQEEEEEEEDAEEENDAEEGDDLDSVLSTARNLEEADNDDMELSTSTSTSTTDPADAADEDGLVVVSDDDDEGEDDNDEDEDDSDVVQVEDDVEENEDETEEQEEDLSDDADLTAEEASLVVATCEAATSCLQERLHRLHMDAVSAESARNQCDVTISREFAVAKHAFDTCEKSASSACKQARKQCEKQRRQQIKLNKLNKVAPTANLTPCTVCVPSNCTFALPLSTNATECSVQKPDLPSPAPANSTAVTNADAAACATDACQELCAAQRQCEKRNDHLVAQFHYALRAHRRHVESCEDKNSDAEEAAVDFVDKCQERNAKVLAACRATMESAAEATNSSATALNLAANVPCPISSCTSPPVTRADCSLAVPMAPKLTKCVDLCSAASCPQRAKCESDNDRMLRRASKAARLRFRCELDNKRAQAKYADEVRSCNNQHVLHIAQCQANLAEAVLNLHDDAQQCMETQPLSQWASQCNIGVVGGGGDINNSTGALPSCPPFKCDKAEAAGDEDDTDNSSDGGPPKPKDCDAIVDALPKAYAALHHCRHTLCKNTIYAKWRGEQRFAADVKKFKKSRLFKEFAEYKQREAQCPNQECKVLAKRTWRRVIINCEVGTTGANCREMRKFKAALVRHHVALVEHYEAKLRKCPKGDAGRTCRRITTRETRRLMRACPPHQSERICKVYRRLRDEKILKKCGASGESAQCRRVRRRCVKHYSPFRGECSITDEKCRKHSWILVEKKCGMKL